MQLEYEFHSRKCSNDSSVGSTSPYSLSPCPPLPLAFGKHGLVISVTNERIKTLCSARHRMTLEFSKARPGNEKFNNNNSSSLRLFVWARLRRNQSDDINNNNKNNNDVPLGKQHTGKQAGKESGEREINCQLKIDQRKWENCAKCKGKVRRWRWCSSRSSSSRSSRRRWRKRNRDRPKRTFWALSTLRQVEGCEM